MNLEDAKYIYTVVGQNLKRLRMEKGLTQEDFAHKSTYSLGFIMNLESSSYSQSISLGTVWHFAKVLEVDIKEFFRPLD
ncbi:MAG: helix-turn-helix domain-containing protein [Bacilli bacterium]|nr:helix-turn-helix domain-containing protein [Bacilli bacterium]